MSKENEQPLSGKAFAAVLVAAFALGIMTKELVGKKPDTICSVSISIAKNDGKTTVTTDVKGSKAMCEEIVKTMDTAEDVDQASDALGT